VHMGKKGSPLASGSFIAGNQILICGDVLRAEGM
jgi:hypothetical protein